MPDDRTHALILYMFAAFAGVSFLAPYILFRRRTDEERLVSLRNSRRGSNSRRCRPMAVSYVVGRMSAAPQRTLSINGPP